MPAPPAAALASPLAPAATVLVAEIDTSPDAVTAVDPSTLAVAVLLTIAIATATSAPGVPSPGLATAFMGAVRVEVAAMVTVPVALMALAPPTLTVAVEFASSPMIFDAGEAGETVDAAERAMLPPVRCASVTVVEAVPLA